jgi:cytidylate kinase
MKNNNFIVMAIDGGAGSGKSTTSRLISEKFNYMHVDTGSHYRLITYSLLSDGILPNDEELLVNLNKFKLKSMITGKFCKLIIDGVEVSDDQLRCENINLNVSSFASIPSVRSLVFNYQRSLVTLAEENSFSGIVMEGRDIGSVILPDANLKLFLHANADIRSVRRKSDGQEDSIILRDKLDSTRKIAPLKAPVSSIPIDTGVHSVDEVLKIITNQIDKL